MKKTLLFLSMTLLILTSCGHTKQDSPWKYIGSYYCNYDVLQPSFCQTQTSVPVYYKPGDGNVVYYGVEDDSGNILEQWVGESAMYGFGTVNFQNFRRGNNIGVVSIKIKDLPCEYWPTH